MRQPWAPLLLLGAVLGASLQRGCCGSLLHSLSYFYLQLPEPSQGLPQFFIRGYLDDQPIARFDSLTRKMEILVPWMEEEEKERFLALSGSPELARRSYQNWTTRLKTSSFSLLPPPSPGSLLHSLSYFYLQLPEPSQGLPQFFIRGYLDDQPIARFDSLTRKMEILVPWMEEEEKERFLAPERIFRAGLEKLSKLDHQAEGLHTWQVIWGCELREDGSKGGFLNYSYDGMDFISFDKETLRWVAAQTQAEKVKEKWEEDPGWSQRNKVYLEEACIEWLRRYLSYKNKTQERTEPPVGKVTRKNGSLEVLTCQAFGFYPKEIQTTWTRDGEVCQNETLQRNVAPNSDGTYYFWLSIKIDPKERDHFWCHLEHKGLQEPLVLAWEEKTATMWWIPVGIVAAVILGLGILFLRCRWRRCRRWFQPKVTTCPDPVSLEMVPSPPIYGTEEEIQSQLML
ncbi:major histocompatibility complex class I-related gene protein-like [Ahaetulla prasina]|uniref:major histocompatibility complex class I-related gene protein-like n=1 Tax=Ahaetulla prasina TaxID=499056 RepID=UPI002648544D|nr:major histocompatibility complex class I-related gene protein-like [Ahaetulla prasina]